jgi:hypothetical protein
MTNETDATRMSMSRIVQLDMNDAGTNTARGNFAARTSRRRSGEPVVCRL